MHDLCGLESDQETLAPLDWWLEPLTELEEARLIKLSKRKCSDGRKFVAADRREEVKLRARKRKAVCGLEDSLAAKLSTAGGLTGAARWAAYHKRSRETDGAPLEPQVEQIARQPSTTAAKVGRSHVASSCVMIGAAGLEKRAAGPSLEGEAQDRQSRSTRG